MNRFFDIEGDVSCQLAPWTLEANGYPKHIARFKLREPIRFRSDLLGGIIEVPVGNISDLASIPQFAWDWFMAPDDPRIELGAWVHDLLYAAKGRLWLESGPVYYSRALADRVLAHEAMPELGASRFQRFAVYEALRRFGDQWPDQSWTERLTE